VQAADVTDGNSRNAFIASTGRAHTLVMPRSKWQGVYTAVAMILPRA